VTVPFAGSQEEADAPLDDGAGDEHAVSAAMVAAAVTTAPARRMRATGLLMTSFRRTTSGGA
jgi:hypothetical protein